MQPVPLWLDRHLNTITVSGCSIGCGVTCPALHGPLHGHSAVRPQWLRNPLNGALQTKALHQAHPLTALVATCRIESARAVALQGTLQRNPCLPRLPPTARHHVTHTTFTITPSTALPPHASMQYIADRMQYTPNCLLCYSIDTANCLLCYSIDIDNCLLCYSIDIDKCLATSVSCLCPLCHLAAAVDQLE